MINDSLKLGAAAYVAMNIPVGNVRFSQLFRNTWTNIIKTFGGLLPAADENDDDGSDEQRSETPERDRQHHFRLDAVVVVTARTATGFSVLRPRL